VVNGAWGGRLVFAVGDGIEYVEGSEVVEVVAVGGDKTWGREFWGFGGRRGREGCEGESVKRYLWKGTLEWLTKSWEKKKQVS